MRRYLVDPEVCLTWPNHKVTVAPFYFYRSTFFSYKPDALLIWYLFLHVFSLNLQFSSFCWLLIELLLWLRALLYIYSFSRPSHRPLAGSAGHNWKRTLYSLLHDFLLYESYTIFLFIFTITLSFINISFYFLLIPICQNDDAQFFLIYLFWIKFFSNS